MTTRTDTFDRANSTSSLGTPSDGGSAWTALSGTWGISSNQAYTSAAISDSLAVLDSGSADTTVGVTVATNSSNPGLIWRASDVNNLFLWTRSGIVYRKQSGSYTSLGTRSTFTSGDVIEVDLSGSTFTGWKNGVSWGADITSTFNQTATLHGLRSDNNTGNRFDDFGITDAGGGTTHEVALSLSASAGAAAARTVDYAAGVSVGVQVAAVDGAAADFSSALTLTVAQALTSSAGLDVSGAVSLAVSGAVTTDGVVDLGAVLALTQQLGAAVGVQWDAQAAVSLTAALTAALVAQGVLQAGLSLSAITAISSAGTVGTIVVSTPDGRTLRIRAEGRVLVIEQEPARLVVRGEDRRLLH